MDNVIEKRKLITPPRLRNFIFGVEDSLVSTVGLLSGIAFVHTPAKTIFLTGVILIFVEAFSMGIGSFLSEYSSETFQKQKEVSMASSSVNGFIMFLSYVTAGFIPLMPYIFLKPGTALPISICVSLISLFILGGFGSRLSRTSFWRGSLRMMIIGGLAILLGTIVGQLVA